MAAVAEEKVLALHHGIPWGQEHPEWDGARHNGPVTYLDRHLTAFSYGTYRAKRGLA